MHEYAIVEHLLEHLQATLRQQSVQRVKEVHVRRGATFAEEPLIQAFQMLSEGTLLHGASLVVEEFSVSQTCPNCEHTYLITCDDLLGHLFLCPFCGAISEVDEARGLEIVSVTVDDEDEPLPVGLKPEHHAH